MPLEHESTVRASSSSLPLLDSWFPKRFFLCKLGSKPGPRRYPAKGGIPQPAASGYPGRVEDYPRTLLELGKGFSTDDACREYLEAPSGRADAHAR